MLVEGISRRGLQRLIADTLREAGTLAGDYVFEPRDWPTTPAMLPALLVQTPRELKQAIFPGQLQFNTTVAAVITGRAAGDDPEEIEETLDRLGGEVIEALLLAPGMTEAVQRFGRIETAMIITAEGKLHVGDVAVTIEIEVYQAFAAAGDALTGFSGTVAVGAAAPVNVQSSAG